jgi:hypothetical protein
MSIASPSLAAIYDRTRYDAILAGVGPRRNKLLAGEYQKAVHAASQELGARQLTWVGGNDVDASFYEGLDLSCVPANWHIVGAAAQPGERIWMVSVGPQGTSLAQWTQVYQFGYRFEEQGYSSEWVPTGSGTHSL